MFLLRRLQRYILLDLLRIFAFLLTVVTVLLVFVGVFQQVRESGLGPSEVLPILPYVVPSLLPFTIPATLLLTVCVVYGRIAGDNEMTAAKAAGINVLSLFGPAFFLGAVLSVCALLLTDQVIPWSVGNIQRIVTMAMENIFLERLRSQNHVTAAQQGLVITVMGVEGKKLIRPYIRYAPSQGEAVTAQAEEATIRFDLDRYEAILDLQRVDIDIPGERKAWVLKHVIRFPLSPVIRRPKPRHQSIREIRKKAAAISQERIELQERHEIETAWALALGDFDRFLESDFIAYQTKLKHDRSEAAGLNTELHGRFALSCSCFFFVLVGCPFSVLKARRQFLTNFILCFFPIVILYYPTILLMMNLSKMGVVNPAWAMWIGNAGLFVAAWFILRRVLRH